MNTPHTPQIGERAPDFTLRDSKGGEWRLAEQGAGKRLALAFYRGHW
ncbi:MAG TPA: redoxin domain-containing protein [Chthonomonadaceae bacterium]|nr:redoxin domain-containing protein [Chthonomonadaceae bacterium]